MRRFVQRKVVWIPLATLLVIVFVFSFFRGGESHASITYGSVLANARAGQVSVIEEKANRLDVHFRDGREFDSQISGATNIVADLQASGVTIGGTATNAVDVRYEPASALDNWIAILFPIVSYVALGFVLYFAVLRAMRKVNREHQRELVVDHPTHPVA
jgi:hypothetical protein